VSTAPPWRRRAEQVMGMPVVLDICDIRVTEAVIDAAFDSLRRADDVFSTYNPDSEISRLNRGELTLQQCSPVVRSLLDRCEAMRIATSGAFDPRAAATWSSTCPDQVPGCPAPVDPSGLVKGWAVDVAAGVLERAGARNYCLDLAGDMRARGHPDDAPHWRIGIRHPREPDSVAAVLGVGDGVIATSACYERGQHIVDPHTLAPPAGITSVTIVGAGDLATADAYATAVFAMVILDDDAVLTTPGLRAWRTS